MEIEINSEKNNRLLERKQVNFTVTHEDSKTPNRALLRSELASKLNEKQATIIIDYVKPLFGSYKSKCYAKIYPSLEKAKKYENKYLIKRNHLKKKKKRKKKKKKPKKNLKKLGKNQRKKKSQKNQNLKRKKNKNLDSKNYFKKFKKNVCLR